RASSEVRQPAAVLTAASHEAPADTATVRDVVATATDGSGAGALGGSLPLVAGGAGAVAMGAGSGPSSGGAPQKLGGEPLAVLSALLAFRGRAWLVAADESRAKLSSSYADIPVSPA